MCIDCTLWGFLSKSTDTNTHAAFWYQGKTLHSEKLPS